MHYLSLAQVVGSVVLIRNNHNHLHRMEYIMFDSVAMLTDAKDNKGGTYTASTSAWYERIEHTQGFMVSLPNGIENVPDEAMSWRFIRDVVESEDFILGLSIGYLGLWQDDSGRWSVDISVLIDERGVALRTAAIYGQRAIWDNAAGEAIDVATAIQFG